MQNHSELKDYQEIIGAHQNQQELLPDADDGDMMIVLPTPGRPTICDQSNNEGSDEKNSAQNGIYYTEDR